MGAFFRTIEIAASPSGHFESIEALVDTGATYTVVPSSVLERLEISPLERQAFIQADGHRVEYGITQVVARIDGRERFTICIFGDEGSTPLLGAVTLEEFGLGVDPIKKRLIPVAGYLIEVC